MPQMVSCPHCHGQIHDDGSLAGQNVSCPHCRGLLLMPATSVQIAPQRAVADQLDFSSPRHHSSAVQVNIRERDSSAHSIGVASLVLGVVGLFMFWMPAIGLGISALGAIIGFVAIAIAAARRGRGVGFGIAGLLLSIAGCAAGGAVTLFVGAAGVAVAEGVNHIQESHRRAIAEKANEKWTDAAHTARLGDIAVQVKSAVIEKPHIVAMGTAVLGDEDSLVIKLLIANMSVGKKIDYTSLCGDRFSLVDSITAEDSFGNRLNKLRVGMGTKIEGAADSGSIYPGKSVLDMVAFERPVPKSTYVRLRISGYELGQDQGDVRIEIPSAMIK